MVEGVDAQSGKDLLLKHMAEGAMAQVMACTWTPISKLVSMSCHAWARARAPGIGLPDASNNFGLESACLSCSRPHTLACADITSGPSSMHFIMASSASGSWCGMADGPRI